MNSVPENYDFSFGCQPTPVVPPPRKVVSPKKPTVTIASIRKTSTQTAQPKPKMLNDFIGTYYVRETTEQRNKAAAEKFNTAPAYETITNPKDMPDTAQKLLEIYEIRSIETNGDTKFYDRRAAEILGVSTRHIINLKNLLRAHNLISTYTEIVHNAKGEARTLQTIRCWRVVYEKHFQIKLNPNWKNDFRPKVTMDNFASVPLPWKIETPKKVNGQVVKPAFEDTMELFMKYDTGLSGEHDSKIHVLKDLNFEHKEDHSIDNKPALDILGYPEEYRCVRGGFKMAYPEYLNHLFDNNELDEDRDPYEVPRDFYESEYGPKEWAEVEAEKQAGNGVTREELAAAGIAWPEPEEFDSEEDALRKQYASAGIAFPRDEEEDVSETDRRRMLESVARCLTPAEPPVPSVEEADRELNERVAREFIQMILRS